MKLVIEKIYCLYSPQIRGIGKVGVAGNVETRRASIEMAAQRMFGDHVEVKCLLKVPILTNAYTFEMALHRAFDRLYSRSKLMKGTTGHTEWFNVRNYVCAILAYFIALAMNWEPECRTGISLGVLFFTVIPLDFALCVVLLAAAEYAIAAGIIYLIYGLLT